MRWFGRSRTIYFGKVWPATLVLVILDIFFYREVDAFFDYILQPIWGPPSPGMDALQNFPEQPLIKGGGVGIMLVLLYAWMCRTPCFKAFWNTLSRRERRILQWSPVVWAIISIGYVVLYSTSPIPLRIFGCIIFTIGMSVASLDVYAGIRRLWKSRHATDSLSENSEVMGGGHRSPL